jgi:hypothetical protein
LLKPPNLPKIGKIPGNTSKIPGNTGKIPVKYPETGEIGQM